MKFIPEKGTEYCLRRSTARVISFLAKVVKINCPFSVTSNGVKSGGMASVLVRGNWIVLLSYKIKKDETTKKILRYGIYQINPKVDKKVISELNDYLGKV